MEKIDWLELRLARRRGELLSLLAVSKMVGVSYNRLARLLPYLPARKQMGPRYYWRPADVPVIRAAVESAQTARELAGLISTEELCRRIGRDSGVIRRRLPWLPPRVKRGRAWYWREADVALIRAVCRVHLNRFKRLVDGVGSGESLHAIRTLWGQNHPSAGTC
jgi:hypothetical protein